MPYWNKETGFRWAANAAENPLSFDVATAVELRFAKLRLINLYSHTLSAYLPRMMIHYSLGKKLREDFVFIYEIGTLQLDGQLRWKPLGQRNKSSPPPFILQGPTNAMHVFVQRAACVQHAVNCYVNFWACQRVK